MKHGKKFKSLSRTKSHRKALMGNLASELVKHKIIKTTLTKGKELRKYIEPVLTKCKKDTTHNRRLVFKALLNNEQAKGLVTELFREVAPKIMDRPGGYTRIIKLPPRQGDNAPMCYIELVDYNEVYSAEGTTEKKTTRRSRRGGAKKTTATTETTEITEAAETTEITEAAETTEASETVVEETKKKVEPKAEDNKPAESEEE